MPTFNPPKEQGKADPNHTKQDQPGQQVTQSMPLPAGVQETKKDPEPVQKREEFTNAPGEKTPDKPEGSKDEKKITLEKGTPLNPSHSKRKDPTDLTSAAYQVTKNIDNRFDAVVNELFASIHATPIRAKLEQKIRELQEEIICVLQEGI